MFIELTHHDGIEIYINAEKIVYFKKDYNRGTKETIINFGESFVYVTETPEEILDIIRKEKELHNRIEDLSKMPEASLKAEWITTYDNICMTFKSVCSACGYINVTHDTYKDKRPLPRVCPCCKSSMVV